MNEAELQATVIDWAHELGLYVFHSTDPRRDIGPGFPDLVICGLEGHLFVELKTQSGQLRHNQTQWRNRLVYSKAPYVVWTPRELYSGVIWEVLVSLSGSDPEAVSVAPRAV